MNPFERLVMRWNAWQDRLAAEKAEREAKRKQDVWAARMEAVRAKQIAVRQASEKIMRLLHPKDAEDDDNADMERRGRIVWRGKAIRWRAG